MKIDSFAVGDSFLGNNGQCIKIVEVHCEKNVVDGKWETFVGYDQKFPDSSKSGSVRVERQKERACNFVRMVSQDSFHTHIKFDKREVVENGYAQATSNTEGKLKKAFLENCDKYKLSPHDPGKTVKIRGRRVMIVGANPRNYKLPIIVEGSSGGRYKVSVEDVRSGLLVI